MEKKKQTQSEAKNHLTQTGTKNDEEGSKDSKIEATTKNSNNQSDEEGDVKHPAKKARSETMPPALDAVFVKNVICENANKFLDKELRMTQPVQRLCNM